LLLQFCFPALPSLKEVAAEVVVAEAAGDLPVEALLVRPRRVVEARQQRPPRARALPEQPQLQIPPGQLLA